MPLAVERTSDVRYAEPLSGEAFIGRLDVYAPAEGDGWPVLVVLHGGGSSKESEVRLSEAIASQGVVVVTPSRQSTLSPGNHAKDHGRLMREAMESVLCAARFARSRAMSFGGDPTAIALLGQSEGGFLGLFVALLGDDLPDVWDAFAEEHGGPVQQLACLTPDGTSGEVEGFIGWNGAYFIFSPQSPFHSPELWPHADPYRYLDMNTDLRIRLIVGSVDQTQPAWHVEKVQAFHQDLQQLGYDTHFTSIEGAGHGLSVDGSTWDRTRDVIMRLLRNNQEDDARP